MDGLCITFLFDHLFFFVFSVLRVDVLWPCFFLSFALFIVFVAAFFVCMDMKSMVSFAIIIQ